ncbi:MAG: hypothetical protein ACLRMJ_02080 [Alistipes finegoldii]
MLAFSAGTPSSISRFDCSTLVTWSVIIFAVLFRFVCDYENRLFANWQLRSVRRESNCRDQRIPKGINAHTDRITGKVSYIPADRIDPIPLSTDMLQRLGMRRNAVRWVKYGVDNLYVDRAVDKFYISIGRLGERVCQVRFVHQLQNILSDGWGVELKLRR